MHSNERLDDMPAPARWIMIFIKQVGFPVVVCIWLAYQQFILGNNTTRAIQDVRDIMLALKSSVDTQNKLLRYTIKHGEE